MRDKWFILSEANSLLAVWYNSRLFQVATENMLVVTFNDGSLEDAVDVVGGCRRICDELRENEWTRDFSKWGYEIK
jgi:hypothetical protein